MDPVPDATPRRSTRLQSPLKSPPPTKNLIPDSPITAPYTPSQIESNKRKTTTKKKLKTPKPLKTPKSPKTPKPLKTPKSPKTPKSLKTPKRTYYKKVVYDGGKFAVNDDVYVKRKEGSEADDSEPEVEECRICFSVGKSLMIECDDCLGGFHLKCLNPKLKKVPEGDWICGFCERKKNGEVVEMPKPPEGKKLKRTMKEKLLSSDLYAAQIERLWKEPNGVFWMRCRWYMIPEETTVGRQPHNLKRELYRTNHSSDVEMETVIRHCFVLNPKEFAEATNAGDDVFYCEYEYDVYYNSFKRISDIQDDDDEENDKEAEKDTEWKMSKSLAYETDDGSESEDEVADSTAHKNHSHELAANSSKGRTFGLHKIGIKKIPEHVRRHKQTDLEKAKQTLLLATLPKSLPCRNNEMDEIGSFIKGAVCGEQWFGRCLYIHGVPGTGKTMSVLAVMRNLRSEVDAGKMRPYSFVEVNGLKLASPENIYKIVYEGLTGNRVGWKKALNLLNERFSDEKKSNKNQPCILLIDEIDLLLTRNQSVLYNILDWPTKPNSKLIVIGIANTMDLPEKLLPRISSRMGIQRLCFGPYNYQQLQEIISTRLKGLDAFEKQAIEFASRKVAAMSGDARRALEICRRAAELADYRHKQSSTLCEGKCHVGIQDIEAAIQEVFQAPHIQMIKTCSRLGKILLVAMVQELYRSGVSELTFEKLATTVFSLCSNNKEELPGWDSLLKVGCKLGQCKIILCEEGVKHRLQKLQLNFPSDDVAFALKDCPDIPWLSKYL